jgi:hypothetical protein
MQKKTLTQVRKITKKLLSPLNARAKEVITGRFGLGEAGQKKTLESIGKKYGITRERVRQIENFALKSMRKAESFLSEKAIFDELKKQMREMGGMVYEERFLKEIAKDIMTQNHIHFYMHLDNDFKDFKEDNNFNKRWSIDEVITDTVHKSLQHLHDSINEEEMIAETVLLTKFHEQMRDLHETYRSTEMLQRYLELSKALGANQMGEWGKKSSPNIKTRGIKDFAYLVIRKAARPMHFREVSKEIFIEFKRKAHTATCHNELIRDKRFVLVGRGMYGLREWGHTGGVVKEVIANVMRTAGKPMKKEEVIDAVKRERMVKDNTIVVNLQNPAFFVKHEDNTYSVKE